MKVNEINNQNFTAYVKTEQAAKYLSKLPFRQSMEVAVMETDNYLKKVDVYISTIEKNGKEKIKAEVGYKTFVENFFRGAVATLRKATKFANKLEEEQIIQNELNKGLTPPRL